MSAAATLSTTPWIRHKGDRKLGESEGHIIEIDNDIIEVDNDDKRRQMNEDEGEASRRALDWLGLLGIIDRQ
jgi:hypothetical protein